MRWALLQRARPGAALALAALVALGCEGSGSSGGGLEVSNEPIAPNCTPFASQFPSGMVLLASGRAIASQDRPEALLSFDLEGNAPALRAVDTIGPDSDLDGVDDRLGNPIGLPIAPRLGELNLAPDGTALLSTSNYEQVLLRWTSPLGPRLIEIATPLGLDVFYPGLPAPGGSSMRAGVSTLACVSPPDPFDSGGQAIGASCNPSAPSFLTSFTAGAAVVGGHLFVATSNLDVFVDRFRPGTVLVYDWDDTGPLLRVAPDAATPVLFTTAFNPTSVAPFTTPGGRNLALVTATGSIGAGVGTSNVRTEGAVDVIDADTLRIVATIPLGFAGPSYDPVAIDPSGSVALLGATSTRHLFAIDLRPLDDPNLYLGGPPVVLDGLSVGFPDARIFDADRPLVLPDRPDGAPAVECDGFTFTAWNDAGDAAFATDWCDGTISTLRVTIAPSDPVPFPRDRFEVTGRLDSFATRLSLGLLRAPSRPRVRPGMPGIDYRGPDVFVLIGDPDAQICALRIESP
ncbi:MAG: hypothetical protein AAF430_24060 [Myxococcota bacterium]